MIETMVVSQNDFSCDNFIGVVAAVAAVVAVAAAVVDTEAHTNHHDTRVIFITYPADARSEAIADARWSAPSGGIAVMYIENVLTYV